MRYLVTGLLCVFLLACGGKDGAAGPTGPQGPAGPAGPGTRLVFVVPVTNGGAVANLPAAAGTNPNSPPSLSCFVTSAGSTTLLAVASTPSSTYPYCGLTFSGGVFHAVMVDSVTGDTAYFVVVY